MEKIVSLFIMMVGSFLFARATGQWGERIIIGDDTLGMLACPIEVDSVLSVKVNKRLSASFNTACWRGYQGVWRLENDTLYLDKIVDCCSFFGNKRVEINTKVFLILMNAEDELLPCGIVVSSGWSKGNVFYMNILVLHERMN